MKRVNRYYRVFSLLGKRRLIPPNNINNHLTAKERINHVYPETIV